MYPGNKLEISEKTVPDMAIQTHVVARTGTLRRPGAQADRLDVEEE